MNEAGDFLRKELGSEPFQFRCHAGISCFLACCHKVELRLFPFDVLRLKNCLQLDSAEFLERHIRLGAGEHPFFPAIMLNMSNEVGHPCPFLTDLGCSVYKDRPSACRTYPLERAVEKMAGSTLLRCYYFMTQHSYCKGHFENHSCTIKQWEREQQLFEHNLFNDLWAEVDALFSANPWQGEGYGGPRQQLAFMACYNLDAFRDYVQQQNLLSAFRLDRDRRRRIEHDEPELLKFGFDWLLHVFGGQRTLIPS